MRRPPDDEARPPATSGRRKRWAVAGVVALALGLVGWQAFTGEDRGADEPPAGGPVSSAFEVPTYDWDGSGGMAAVVSGTLWFTPEGCTLMSNAEGSRQVTRAVVFPNATGVTYSNGVRAVVDDDGDVFAIEGQEFAYGGGYVVEPATPLGESWLAQCPDANLREGAVVNDEPAGQPLTEDPTPPSEAGPTAPTSDEELGFFPVPTVESDPADGGAAARLDGTVVFTADGCPTLESREGEQPVVTGLLFLHAEGFRDPHHPDDVMIYSTSPDGVTEMVAMDGDPMSYTGVAVSVDDERWVALCGDSPVDAVLVVHGSDHLPD